MGYYTYYKLKIESLNWDGLVPQCEHAVPIDANFCPECGKQVKDVCVIDLIWEVIKDDSDNTYYGVLDGSDRCKWYSHDEDMRKLSERFPRVLFTLSGEGEESSDIWKKYYLNGKCQVAKAQITIDKFDPEKLE